MHTEGYGAGGNDVAVRFLGKATNLHAAWDTAIPNRMLNTTSPGFIEALGWANNLGANVNAGKFKHDVKSWIKHHDIKKPAKSATKWAQDSNKLVCEYVLEDGPKKINGTEIGGKYYEDSVDIVEMQIAKGGIRLAAWLNMIFEGKTGF